MGEKTLEPKTWAPGAVRSVVPRAPPFGCHCAAMTFCVLVRAMTGRLRTRRGPVVVHADNARPCAPVHAAQRSTGWRGVGAEVPPHGQRPGRRVARESRP